MTAGVAVPAGDATYRELLDAAFSDVGRASVEMMRTRFVDASQARAAVDAYRDLLDAVRTHLEYFLPVARNVPPGAADLDIADPPGFVAPLTTGVALLGARARRSAAPAEPAHASRPATAWREAAGHLRAARELLDTHRDADMGWRTPDAWLLDSRRPQAAAVASIADLLRIVANSGQALALRTRETSRSVNCADLLNPAPLRIAAASLRHPARQDQPIAALDELTAARTTTPVSAASAEPLAAGVAAMHALRQRAWEHARDPDGHPSIRTVGHYALLAVAVHHHVGALAAAAAYWHRQRGSDSPSLVRQLRHAAAANYAGAQHWREVYSRAATLHTTAAADVETYRQILDVRANLESLTRSDNGWRPASEMFPDHATCCSILAAGYRVLRPIEEISTWQAASVRRLVGMSELFVAATTLRRDDVSDDPRLVTARLARRLAPLPAGDARDVVRACHEADRATWTSVKATRACAGPAGPLARPRLTILRATHRAAGRPSVGL